MLSELKKRGKDFIFYVVGQGPHVKKFSRFKDKLNLSQNVIFTGSVSDKSELNKYYAGADIMLFPSVFDSDGLVLIEAAEQGLPSLTVKGTGAAERITDNVTGFTAENSVKEFADKIELLMDNPQLLKSVGENAKKIYTDWEDTAEKYIELYEKLIKNKGN